MTWNDLTKQNKLLIYMSRKCIDRDTPFVVKDYIDDVIAYGITTSKVALYNLLYNLSVNGFVISCRLPKGMNGYWLTVNGQDYAEWLISTNDDLKVPDFTSLAQPNKTKKTHITDVADLVKIVADIVAQSYGTQPKQNENVDASNLEKNATSKTTNTTGQPKKTIDYGHEEEIVRLRIENADLKEQIARKQEYQQNIAAELDKKTKECERLKNGYDRLSNTLAQLCGWIDSIKNGGN